MSVNVSRFSTYPLREKWVGDVVACIVRIGLSRPDSQQHHVPTSHEVGMERETHFVVGDNITYPLLTKWVWSARRASL